MSHPAETTLVVVPTYNERDNLDRFVRAVLAADPSLEVLVVDDASPDGTGEIADRLAVATGRVYVMHRAGKLGLGSAYVAGFKFALNRGYAAAVQMDADFSHRPEDLPRLLASLRTNDVAIGSRYVRGGSVTGWTPVRHAISRGGSLYARTLLRLPLRDCTSGFKGLRRTALQRLDLSAVQAGGFGFNVEINCMAHRAGLRIAEIPITFPDRTAGCSKLSRSIVAEAALLVWRMRHRSATTVTRPIRQREPARVVSGDILIAA